MNIRLFLLALTASFPLLSTAQVGNGLIALSDPIFQFEETEVGSTATATLNFVNSVGAPQTVTFTGLASPFSLESASTTVVSAGDTASVVITFVPTAPGNYSTELVATGDVFGEFTLPIAATGTLVSLEFSVDSIDFGNVPIGQTTAYTFSISNVGQGTGTYELPDLTDSPFNIRERGPLIAAEAEMSYFLGGAPGLDSEVLHYTRFTVRVSGPNPENSSWCIYDTYVGWISNCENGSEEGYSTLLPDSARSNLLTYDYFTSIEVDFSPSNDNQTLEIIDTHGLVVYSQTFSGNNNITISNTPTEVGATAGQYAIKQPIEYVDPIDANCRIRYSEFTVQVEGPGADEASWYVQGDHSGASGHLSWSSEQPASVPMSVFLPDFTHYQEPESLCPSYNYESYIDLSQGDDEDKIIVKDLLGNVIYERQSPGTTYDILSTTIDQFSLQSGLVAESDSVVLVAEYSPANAGSNQLSIAIETNDQNLPVHTLNLSGTGTAEVFGEVCDNTWTTSDGTINLIGDISILPGCSLTIDSSCVVLMNGHSIDNQGNLIINQGVLMESGLIESSGTIDISGIGTNPVNLTDVSIYSTGSADVEHCNQPTSTTPSGYFNDFSTEYSGWYLDGPGGNGWDGNQLYNVYQSSCCWSWEIESPLIEFTGTGYVSTISFDFEYYIEYTAGQNCLLQIETDQTNGWHTLADLAPIDYEDSNEWLYDYVTPNWSGSISIPAELQEAEWFHFRLFDSYGGGRIWNIDNVSIGCFGQRSDSYALDNYGSFSFWGGDFTSLKNYSSNSISTNSASSIIEESTLETLYSYGNGTTSLEGCIIEGGFGITTHGQLNVEHSIIRDCTQGIVSNGPCSISNSNIHSCSGIGIEAANGLSLDFVNIAFNHEYGVKLKNSFFRNIKNSVLWGNNGANAYSQVTTESGILSVSYSIIQGYNEYGVEGSQYYWGEGMSEADPLFLDEDLHLNTYSPAVDAAEPWLQDQHMPFGLGGVRADMGAFGGPNNAFWGGLALPNGASLMTGVIDSPQDQGGMLGLTFDASFYDNSDIVNNVTSYAFWRHFDPTGQSIAELEEGNWELIGTMPAQGFGGYAYQAATLGNTNDSGPFSSCYTVVAHTADEDTYWYSNVMCGESIDNLAPNAPDLNGMVLEEGGAQVSWADPDIEDYGYTRITSDSGFEAEISADTLVVDLDALPGSTVTYSATHFDVNGNESDPSDITLVIGEAFDVIALQAGWNLISLDREPADASISALFTDLIPGNLQYVTGFDEGVSFHDPSGLPFLNTLDALSPGYGYWVKVQENDTLRATGTPLGGGYLPTLDAGWNLIAYTAATPLAPTLFFSDLIANEELVYVTGFDGGVQVFDPAGLPFLNSLEVMQNGFGYWVKTVSDFEGLEIVSDGKATPNPNYIVLNGTSNLGDHAGQSVSVVTGAGDIVGHMPILEGGHLMTTAVYGAGQAESVGIMLGEPLFLEFAGERTEMVVKWTGDMVHTKLDVSFDGPSFSVFPNPATDRFDIRWEQVTDGRVTAQLHDAQGRIVSMENLGDRLSGAQQATISAGQFAAGYYSLRLLVDGRAVYQSGLQLVD